MAAVILEPQKIKSATFSPSYLPWTEGTGCHDLCFLNVELYANFFILVLLIKRIFSSSLFSAIRMVASAYLRLLIFLLIILILACASFFLTLHMMYSTYKLNRMVVIYSLDVLLSQLGTTLNVCNFYLSTIPQESWGENTSYPALNESLLLWNKQGRNKRQLWLWKEHGCLN